MADNVINSVLNRQYGFPSEMQYDPLLYRLREVHNSSVFHNPVFACKRAAIENKEHIVGLANEDGKLYVMDTQSHEKNGATAHNNAIFDLTWRFGQMQIVTASGDHTAKLFDLENGGIRETRMFCGHTRSLKTVAFRTGDSSVFATGSRDGKIILWDTRIEQHNYIGTPDFTITSSHSGKDAATPSKRKNKLGLATYVGVKSVTGLVFQNPDTLVSCGAGDGLIKLWDLRKHYTVNKKEPLPKHSIPYQGKTGKNGYSNLLIDNQGIKLYANCLDNTIYCYNVASYSTEPVMTYKGHQNNTYYIKAALCKEENYLVSGSSDENAYIWNLKCSEPIVKLTGHSAEVTCVAWCGNNTIPTVVTCSDDMSHKIWSIGNGDFSSEEAGTKGKAEVLPLPQKPSRKRYLGTGTTHLAAKKFIRQCKNCEKTTMFELYCESCLLNNKKRKADCDLWSDSKRLGTDFGPRRLFAHLHGNFLEIPSGESFQVLDKPEPNDCMDLNALNSALESFKTSESAQAWRSPTSDLPNFVIDGTAPHLNYSPPKKRPIDWLTRMCIERNLRQDMMDLSCQPTPPKLSKLETTPKSNRKTPSAPKSPLLRFFRVTSSSSTKNDSCCSPKNQQDPNRNSQQSNQ